jgi:hypothetical protein
MPTDRAAIRAFLESALADGAVRVRDLEAKARAEGLLPPDLAISQCKPFRRVAEKLHILHFREDDRWLWRLPVQDARKPPEGAPNLELDAPDVSPEPVKPPAQDDLAARRRKHAEETVRWFSSPEFKEAMRKGREAVDRYLVSGNLADLQID